MYLFFLDPNIHQHTTNYFLLALSLKPILLGQERCSGRAHAVFGMFVKHGGPGCKTPEVQGIQNEAVDSETPRRCFAMSVLPRDATTKGPSSKQAEYG